MFSGFVSLLKSGGEELQVSQLLANVLTQILSLVGLWRTKSVRSKSVKDSFLLLLFGGSVLLAGEVMPLALGWGVVKSTRGADCLYQQKRWSFNANTVGQREQRLRHFPYGWPHVRKTNWCPLANGEVKVLWVQHNMANSTSHSITCLLNTWTLYWRKHSLRIVWTKI